MHDVHFGKMHVVLSRWYGSPFKCTSEPPDRLPRPSSAETTTVPRDELKTCFDSISRVFWYHAYVYELLGEDVSAGFGESNVVRTYDTLSAKGGAEAADKIALLDILKLVYRYNYSVA